MSTSGSRLIDERVGVRIKISALWVVLLVLYGGAMSNSNVHNHSPLPILVAGGAAGKMKGGRHIKYPENTPMANLLMTILEKAGIPQESVGDSTGFLSEV